MIVAILFITPPAVRRPPSASGDRPSAEALPDLASVRAAYAPSDARLLDRHGVVVHELRVDAKRRRLEWTPLAEISPALVTAVIASEDRRFREHGGVDWRALAAAAWARLTGGAVRGASTLSMQLAALLSPDLQRGDGPRDVSQKWAQMRGAWRLERAWTKDEILEAYLNLVTFRGELQGVAAASAVLFDKQPHGLSTEEALVLAALLRAPNAGGEALRHRVEALALRGGQGSGGGQADENASRHCAGDVDAALRRALDRPRGTGPRVKLAPHVARRMLTRGQGVAVRSTLDASLQRFAGETLRRHLLVLAGREVRDGAVLVVDNETGEVLAYVGSSGDLSRAAEVDGVRARRQAGSSLKPFLYALALDARLITPATLLDDAPLEIPVGGALYRPQNYDEEFRGLVSARAALAASLNVPAVRVLQLAGTEAFAETLRRLGFRLDRSADDYGPSLALGSADITLWELVGAYRALANGGAWSPLTLTPGGAASGERRVFSRSAAFLAADILSDRESRTLTFGLENPLVTRFWTAVKTGTSKDMRDNWCAGFSRRYTVGVWVGNFSGRPMHAVSGISGAAPVWLEIMEWLHRDAPSEPPPVPASIVSRRVAFAGAWEPERDERFIAGTERDGVAGLAIGEIPRITAPASETIIALDPDIPAARQRVLLEARGDGMLVLDGTPIGPASRKTLWSPTAGRHQLVLLDARGRVLHGVSFVVRGSR